MKTGYTQAFALLRMARFFKYKTLNEFKNDVKRLGLEIEFEESLEKIFQPVFLFGRKAGNALAIHPMEGCDATADGRPDELTRRRYLRFARGGAKLIWGEATAVAEEARANPRQLWLTEKNVDDFARLVEQIRKSHQERFSASEDLILGLQLAHSGRWSYKRPILGVHNNLIDPLTRLAGKTLPPDYPLISDDELKKLEDQFAQVARLAYCAGFDFIDLKQCHSYLLNELLGARTRPGIYGGSWENRTRFIRNVIEKIKILAPGLNLASRLNIYDGIPWRMHPETGEARPILPSKPPQNGFGINPENVFEIDFAEPIKMVKLLKKLGVGLVNLSMGSPYFNAHLGRPFEKPAPDMYPSPEHPLIGVARHIQSTARIKMAVPDLPVIGTGYSWLRFLFPYVAEANIRKGKIDFVGLGRGAIAYPDFAADLIEKGKLEPEKVCLAVSFCTALMRRKDNKAGQYPSGCVPRDPLYAKIYSEFISPKGKTHSEKNHADSSTN